MLSRTLAEALALSCLATILWTAIPAGAAFAPPPGNRLQWKEAEGTWIPIPPAEHPRLFVRRSDVPDLKRRLTLPALKPLRDRLVVKDMAKGPRFDLELAALDYLINGDKEKARATVAQTLDFLRRFQIVEGANSSAADYGYFICLGAAIVTGSMVYDWCYDVLTDRQKQDYHDVLLHLCKNHECKYPPRKASPSIHGNWFTGHIGERLVMRDQMSAGIALYDEHPEIYNTVAGYFFRYMIPPRDWVYRGQAHHQGASYGPLRFACELFPLWIFDRMGAGSVFSSDQQYVPYLWIYRSRADGQRLLDGDNDRQGSLRPGDQWPLGAEASLCAAYYKDAYIQGEYLRAPHYEYPFFQLLWNDTELQPRPRAELPLTRYFGSPFGWMVARSGWEGESAVVEMRIGEYNFENHHHRDAGAFQIYYKGPLAIDSGIYGGKSGRYGSDHWYNYYTRTIAHNSLLIYNPKESFDAGGGKLVHNDGGQWKTAAHFNQVPEAANPVWKTGEILGHGFGPDPQVPEYSYLKGDIASAYGEKAKEVKRAFVFLNLKDQRVPAALIVFDKVVSSQADFRKYWLLHSIEQPKVSGSVTTVECTGAKQGGRLVNTALLPEAANLETEIVGGPGKEYWVFDTNYANDLLEKHQGRCLETGDWRVQLSPRTPATDDYYLNVMQMTDREAGALPEVALVRGTGLVGCRVGDRLVLFNDRARRSDAACSFETGGAAPCRILVTDLAPGAWKVRGPWTEGERTVQVSETDGTAWLEGPAGRYELTR